MTKDFFRSLIDDLGDPDTTMAADKRASSDLGAGLFINTGSYMLNAALGGSIMSGIPVNRVVALAGETTVGKSFLALAIAKEFLSHDPRARLVIFDTESAITNELLTDRGIDLNRVSKSEPASLEGFRTTCYKLLDAYSELPQKERFPLLIILDSLSALPSAKEVGDVTTAGKETTKDMTKPGVIKGIFRLLRLKLAKCQVPMLVTSHVYAVIGSYVPTKDMAGGSGLKYAADAIVFLSKKKDKIDNEVVGNIIHVHMMKSRYSRENTKTDTRILYDGGLDKYYGLLPAAVQSEVVQKVGNKYKFPNGTTAFEKAILKSPEKFWTKEVLDQLETYIAARFKYTSGAAADDDEESDDE